MRTIFTNQQKTKTRLRQAGAFIIALLVANLFLVNNSSGQTTIYSQNFGTGTSFPTGWSASSGAWTNNNGVNSSGYTGASGGSNAAFINSVSSGNLTYSNNLSTIGYTNITVLWGARLFTGFPGTITFQWSPDGTNWNTQTFTNVSANSTWALVNGGTRIALPAGAAGSTNLSFRFVISGAGTGSNTSYRVDDFSVQGTSCGTITASATKNDVTCFNTSTGVITITGSGGTSPYTFSIDNGSNFNATTIGGASYVPINATSGKFINLPVNSYKIMVQDANGCKSKSVQ